MFIIILSMLKLKKTNWYRKVLEINENTCDHLLVSIFLIK